MEGQVLLQNIYDTIKEWQIKIGYQEESMGLYYPANSLKRLMKLPENMTLSELLKKLDIFLEGKVDTLGKVVVSNQKDRICLQIPKEGTAYVHEHILASPFLKEFIEKITMPGCTLEEIKKVFYKYSTNVVEKDGIHDGLGRIFYFEDETIDSYVYCLEFDEFGATYHRFDKLDFQHL
ncbi:MAG: DUF3877 family protein [Clostridiales bacterium]|nr:DUF3877 family protein [Clostridiales bacterium]